MCTRKYARMHVRAHALQTTQFSQTRHGAKKRLGYVWCLFSFRLSRTAAKVHPWNRSWWGTSNSTILVVMSSQLENILKTVYIVHFRLRAIKAYTPGVYANLEAFTKEGFYNWDGSTGQSETGLSRTVTV